MPWESNGACNYCLNSSSHLSLLKAGMYLWDNPTALIITWKSIWAINAVSKECVLNHQGKVAYFLELEGSMLKTVSQQLAELVKFPRPAWISLNTSVLKRSQSHWYLEQKGAIWLCLCTKYKTQEWNDTVILLHCEKEEAMGKRGVCVHGYSLLCQRYIMQSKPRSSPHSLFPFGCCASSLLTIQAII